MLLAVDTEKAFDRVHWPYLEWILTYIGLGDKIRKHIFNCYHSPTARVRVNGHMSTQLPIHRGTRQGCPLSPLLFAFFMEPLARRVRNHPQITGIQLGGDTHTISLYADDILVALGDASVSLGSFLEELDSFSGTSGFKINLTKSTALNLSLQAQTKTDLQTRYPLKWSTDTISYLGLQLSSTLPVMRNANYSLLHTHICSALQKWRHYPLSWLGRITAIKMTILPKILYLFQTLPLPPQTGLL